MNHLICKYLHSLQLFPIIPVYYVTLACWLYFQRCVARFQILITGTLSARRLSVYCFVAGWEKHTCLQQFNCCVYTMILPGNGQLCNISHSARFWLLGVMLLCSLLMNAHPEKPYRDTANSSGWRGGLHITSVTRLTIGATVPYYLQHPSFRFGHCSAFIPYRISPSMLSPKCSLIRAVCSIHHSPLWGAPLLVCSCHLWGHDPWGADAMFSPCAIQLGGWPWNLALLVYLPPPGGLPSVPLQVYHSKLLPPCYCPSYLGMN